MKNNFGRQFSPSVGFPGIFAAVLLMLCSGCSAAVPSDHLGSRPNPSPQNFGLLPQSLVSCPASIVLRVAATPPSPWKVEGASQTEHKFLRPSIFNGTPGKEEFELAPDNQNVDAKQVRQTWNLADYRDQNLFVRCRYEGTAVTLSSDLPAPLKTCSFTFRNVGGTQPIASPVFECR